jgi:hypothetical protein
MTEGDQQDGASAGTILLVGSNAVALFLVLA